MTWNIRWEEILSWCHMKIGTTVNNPTRLIITNSTNYILIISNYKSFYSSNGNTMIVLFFLFAFVTILIILQLIAIFLKMTFFTTIITLIIFVLRLWFASLLALLLWPLPYSTTRNTRITEKNYLRNLSIDIINGFLANIPSVNQ